METYKCATCNGEGRIIEHKSLEYDDDYKYSDCPKCLGKGEINWLENVFGVEQGPKSVLDRLNVRRLILHLQKSLEGIFQYQDITTGTEASHLYLQNLQSKQAFQDYFIDEQKDGIYVYVKPNRTVELVRIDVKVKEGIKDGNL